MIIVITIILINFYSKKVIKIDMKEVGKIKLNTQNPICCLGSYCVYDEDNNYVLRGNGYEQSSFDKKTYENQFSYSKEIAKFIDKNPQIKSICILGFGLGGLPLKYSKSNQIKMIDCVEIDMSVYILYNSIIDSLPKKVNYYLGDAENFLLETDKKYDLIIDDIFTSEKIFYDYKNAKKCLNKNGALFINMHYVEDFKKYEEYLKKLFSKVYYIENDNICIFCIN